MKFNLTTEIQEGQTVTNDPEQIKQLKCKSDKGADIRDILYDVLLKIQEAEQSMAQEAEINAVKMSTANANKFMQPTMTGQPVIELGVFGK